MAVLTVRGAITCENTKESIAESTREMISEIFKCNNIKEQDLISILFTATKDIDMAYPALFVREMGISDVTLMCVQEMYVVGSLPKCIRVLVTFNTEKTFSEINHVYLKEAKKLRPDLQK